MSASEIPDGVDFRVARMAVVFKMVQIAYPNGEEFTNSETKLRNLVNAYLRATKALDDGVELKPA